MLLQESIKADQCCRKFLNCPKQVNEYARKYNPFLVPITDLQHGRTKVVEGADGYK
jgi:hypothetical protein